MLCFSARTDGLRMSVSSIGRNSVPILAEILSLHFWRTSRIFGEHSEILDYFLCVVRGERNEF